MSIQNEIRQLFLSNLVTDGISVPNKLANTISMAKSVDYQNMFYNNNLEQFEQTTEHMGTDSLVAVNQKILNNFKLIIGREALRIKFYFGHKVVALQSINQESSRTKVITEPETEMSKDNTCWYDKVIVAVGRYGSNLINDICQQAPELIQSNNKVDLGVRLEVKKIGVVDDLDKRFYEWKIKYKTQNNLMVRTFCHNPNGYVVTENYDIQGSKITTANGHSRTDAKSDNTNLAILVTHEFTEPFNDSTLFGKNIAEQSNLLAGEGRVIVQTLKDFKSKKRSNSFFRVRPTLPSNSYTLGDLSYVLPAKTYEAIIEFLGKLGVVVPEIQHDDNLLYGVEVKFYGPVMKNNDKIKFIGDCSGRSRSIIAAGSMGYILANEIICGRKI